MGKFVWTAVAAVAWAVAAAVSVVYDAADRGVVFGLLAITFAVLALRA